MLYMRSVLILPCKQVLRAVLVQGSTAGRVCVGAGPGKSWIFYYNGVRLLAYRCDSYHGQGLKTGGGVQPR